MSKLLIPNQELPQLLCLSCQNSLSIFPIYTKDDGSGGICGRCQRTETDQFIRDEAYEAMAQFFSFPCIYKSNGCNEYELPSKLLEHERSCDYRPNKSYTDSRVIKVQNDPNIRLDLLAEVECPVCYDYMVKPIYQCLDGHSICKYCKSNLPNCPICTQRIDDTRNFTLEKLTGLLTYPCKFQKSGCCYSSKCTDIEIHENSCEFRSFACPLEDGGNCRWNSNRNELPKHIMDHHNDSLLKSDKVDVPFNQEINSEIFRLIIFSKSIFKMYYKYTNKKFYWSVQLVGTANECKQFKYEIDIIDQSGCERRFIWIGLIVPSSIEHDDDTDKYLMTFEQLESFIKECISFKIRIIKV